MEQPPTQTTFRQRRTISENNGCGHCRISSHAAHSASWNAEQEQKDSFPLPSEESQSHL